jgi:hypothetical protein
MATNRDEMLDRPWTPPGHHWPDRPEVVAGRDDLAGGTWFGVNRSGVVAAILNRHGTLGPAPGMRTRGEIVLEALDHADAAEAAKALAALNATAYRPFNMVVADNRDAFWIRSLGCAGATGLRVEAMPEGLSMITANDLNDAGSARIRFHRPRFVAAPAPDPDNGNWQSWEKLMGSRESEPEAGPHGAMTIVTGEAGSRRIGYGTCSSSLLALASPGRANRPGIQWRFAAGAPDVTPYAPVTL